jgi:hypothetical protein
LLGQEEHHDAVLAEILLSERVGLAHIRLVGDVISTRAQLSMLLQGRVGLSFDQRAELVEEVLDLEDAYRDAWQKVSSGSYAQNRVEYLAALDHALRAAAEGMASIIRRIGGSP